MNLYIIENGKPVAYARKGQCLRCGRCCRYRIDYRWRVEYVPKDADKDNSASPNYTPFEGWSQILAMGLWWWIRVDAITEEESAPANLCANFCPETNQCRVFKDLQDFGTLCWFWPVHPDNLLPFPGCGFSFEKVQEAAE